MTPDLVTGGGQLFGREYELQIYSGPQATADVNIAKYNAIVYKNGPSGDANLRIQFAVEQKATGIDGGARIQIYNMAAQSRSKLFIAAQVRLYAGYPDNRSLIFAGSIRQFLTKRAGPDNVTTLTCDGLAMSVSNFIFNKTYKGVTTLAQILLDMQKSTHVRISSRGDGTVVKLNRGQFAGVPDKTYANGLTFHDPVDIALNKILPSPYEAKFDNGELVITAPNSTIPNLRLAVNVSFQTGMIGTPSTTVFESAVALQFQSLINPRLRVGAFCLVYAPTRKEPYQCRITSLKIQGDTHEGAWQMDCVAEVLSDIRSAASSAAAIVPDNFSDSGDAEGDAEDDGDV